MLPSLFCLSLQRSQSDASVSENRTFQKALSLLTHLALARYLWGRVLGLYQLAAAVLLLPHRSEWQKQQQLRLRPPLTAAMPT